MNTKMHMTMVPNLVTFFANEMRWSIWKGYGREFNFEGGS